MISFAETLALMISFSMLILVLAQGRNEKK
ncbi:hypothetical protein J2S11_003101 [Bacillus horti]|uniref:Hydrophobic toxin n=1 Tax=Caldalkalibacillus horti TaxID=77523 RepID=A0ABT9W1Q9_9BACI|nr:hypothetical protein [Bacillus horti]